MDEDRRGRVVPFAPRLTLEQKIIRELHTALDLLDAPVGYLAALGSYKDTLSDQEVLDQLTHMNGQIREDVGERMECYIAENNDTVAWQRVKDMGAGAGLTDCFECFGSGFWPYLPDAVVKRCVDCKGTGKVYVSL